MPATDQFYGDRTGWLIDPSTPEHRPEPVRGTEGARAGNAL
jgi:hypothetical protein